MRTWNSEMAFPTTTARATATTSLWPIRPTSANVQLLILFYDSQRSYGITQQYFVSFRFVFHFCAAIKSQTHSLNHYYYCLPLACEFVCVYVYLIFWTRRMHSRTRPTCFVAIDTACVCVRVSTHQANRKRSDETKRKKKTFRIF